MTESIDDTEKEEIPNMNGHFDIIKFCLIKDLFIFTADENYISFRICLINGIDNEMSWQAAHALEKYIKAVLVLNDISVKKISHNICDLYDELTKLASELLPQELEIGSTKVNPIDFIKFLSGNGNPNNRYGVYGYSFSSESMVLMDNLVFSIRRLACNLERQTGSGKTYRQKLLEEPKWRIDIDESPLDELINGDSYREIRDFVLDNNDAFAPNDFVHKNSQMLKRGVGKSSPFAYYIPQVADFQKNEFIEWIDRMIKLPKDVTEEINKLKSQH